MAPLPRPVAAVRRTNRSVPLGLVVAAVAVWRCSSVLGDAFTAAGLLSSPGRGRSLVSRGAYAFDIVQSDVHKNLVKEEKDGNVRISTHGTGILKGNWNTVLGDKELPAAGRSYWEVKIVSKPSDAWEYIGVAEAKSDISVPLPRNRKGEGYFWGATWSESMLYQWLPLKPEYNAQLVKRNLGFGAEAMATKKFDVAKDAQKQMVDQMTKQAGNLYKVPGTIVGIAAEHLPPFKPGLVIGVDVDMDKGTLSFWADGKYMGPVRDTTTSKPVNIKGKKLVPAMSVFGRTTGARNEYTVMELRTGIEPPPLPK